MTLMHCNIWVNEGQHQLVLLTPEKLFHGQGIQETLMAESFQSFSKSLPKLWMLILTTQRHSLPAYLAVMYQALFCTLMKSSKKEAGIGSGLRQTITLNTLPSYKLRFENHCTIFHTTINMLAIYQHHLHTNIHTVTTGCCLNHSNQFKSIMHVGYKPQCNKVWQIHARMQHGLAKMGSFQFAGIICN